MCAWRARDRNARASDADRWIWSWSTCWNTGAVTSSSSPSKSVKSWVCQNSASAEIESVLGRCFILFSSSGSVFSRGPSWSAPLQDSPCRQESWWRCRAGVSPRRSLQARDRQDSRLVILLWESRIGGSKLPRTRPARHRASLYARFDLRATTIPESLLLGLTEVRRWEREPSSSS